MLEKNKKRPRLVGTLPQTPLIMRPKHARLNSGILAFLWAIPGRFFHYFCLFKTVDSKHSIYFLPMTGFEPQTSGIGRDWSANWATTTAPGRCACYLKGTGHTAKWRTNYTQCKVNKSFCVIKSWRFYGYCRCSLPTFAINLICHVFNGPRLPLLLYNIIHYGSP